MELVRFLNITRNVANGVMTCEVRLNLHAPFHTESLSSLLFRSESSLSLSLSLQLHGTHARAHTQSIILTIKDASYDNRIRVWSSGLMAPLMEKLAVALLMKIKLLAVPLIQLTNKIKMNEHDKIRELSQQLAIEKKRCAAYKRQLELLFEHIEEHNNSLSKKIQHIVGNVKEIEAEEQQRHR
ncbi:hypothetical protein Ahy_A08g039048 isoform A [Arachis hypogaea]|uniref:Uncharacterized protein n=1 Tax=Arachis hypogaea TaxID=3818 RepID=A0A445BV47_ARAHY|nr:hypothetical protein Ahy_A08g039048 isoform A [Arachis hypogaea]